jgi:hypothetical protein
MNYEQQFDISNILCCLCLQNFNANILSVYPLVPQNPQRTWLNVKHPKTPSIQNCTFTKEKRKKVTKESPSNPKSPSGNFKPTPLKAHQPPWLRHPS